MVCACDLRYATTQASFCIQETNIGVMADLGVLQRLPRFIPEAVVRELAYTGDALPASRACELGFVSATFETQEAMLEKVMQIAAKIGSRPPLVVAGIKEMITYARDHSVADSLRYCASWQTATIDPGYILESLKAAKDQQQQPGFPNLKPLKTQLE